MKRWGILILVCLLLGAVTTVAVAWGCRWHGRNWWLNTNNWSINASFGLTWIDEFIDERSLKEIPARITAAAASAQPPEPGLVLYWRHYFYHQEVCGWPWPALMSYEWYCDDGWAPANAGFIGGAPAPAIVLEEGGIPMPDWWGSCAVGTAWVRLLPIRPLWVGFTLDAVLYSVGWGALIAAIGFTRRYGRIRTCHCASCGYSLTGNTSGVCPECGAAIAPLRPGA